MKKLLILLIIPFLSFGQDNCGDDLGEDITTCEEEITLDSGEGYDSYEWSTGETSQTIIVTESGSYSVEVTTGSFDCSSEECCNNDNWAADAFVKYRCRRRGTRTI